MALKKFNPTSPGRRFMTALTFDEITKDRPEKALTEPKKRSGGRNIPGLKIVDPSQVNIYDVLDCGTVLLSQEGLAKLEERLAP